MIFKWRLAREAYYGAHHQAPWFISKIYQHCTPNPSLLYYFSILISLKQLLTHFKQLALFLSISICGQPPRG